MVEFVCVVENTLSYKTTWNSWPLWLESFPIDTFLLVQPEVTNLDNWVAVSEFINWEILTIQLVGISRFYVPSMVLIEVVKLIIHIDWTFYFFFYCVQRNNTVLIVL